MYGKILAHMLGGGLILIQFVVRARAVPPAACSLQFISVTRRGRLVGTKKVRWQSTDTGMQMSYASMGAPQVGRKCPNKCWAAMHFLFEVFHIAACAMIW